MKALRSTPPSLTALLVALAACTSSARTADPGENALIVQRAPDLRPELAQVNDVSILYPLAKTDDEIARLVSASAEARGGALLPSSLYEQAFGGPAAPTMMGPPAAPAHADLRVVAARFDPCFGAVGPIDDASCTNQLRLIFQRVNVDFGADDTAVHAFYALTRAELRDAVQAIIALRRAGGDDRLGPLAPHPRMVSEGFSGATTTGVNALVRRVAGAENLTRITVFTMNGMAARWNFSGFDIANGVPVRMTIPNLPEPAPMVSFFAGLRVGELTAEQPFSPPATGARPEDDMQLLGNADHAAAPNVTATERQAAFHAAVRIENPSLHSPDTVDCASCHAADPARRLVGEKRLGLTVTNPQSLFVADPTFVPAADLAPTSVDPRSVNVHMFSYRGNVASIHRRTINESAAIVAYLNANVLDARR